MPRVAASKKTVVEEIPEASEVSSVASGEVKPEVALKGLTKADMMKLLLSVMGEEALSEVAASKKKTGRKTKEDKVEKEKKEKKTGSQPKGKVPKQLLKPRAWVEFTLEHALSNGWEEFVIHQSKTDKETGEKTEEEIVMPASELNEDGAHVYEGTIGSKKYPSGRQMIQKEAMSLSKQRWAPKAKAGTHPELYEEFEAQYEEPEDEEDAKSETTESSSKVVKRMTIAEKEEEQARKKAEKEAEKAKAKAEKDAEKAAAKAEKEAIKAAKLAEKSVAPKKTASSAKAPIPAAAAKSILAAKMAEAKAAKASVSSKGSVMEEEEEEEPVTKPVAKPVVKKPVVKKIVEEWSCPDDGKLHPWTFGGKKYVRTFSGEIYEAGKDGNVGAWAGMWDEKKGKIDDSIPEPEYEDEE
jgi:hypothetical protein